MEAAEIKRLLGLEPHPREGGCFVRTYEARTLTEGGQRRTASAIYYLLEPDTFSEMHRLRSDEIFHFYAGDPVEQLQLSSDGTGQLLLLSNDLAAGGRPQVVVPAGVWQGARLIAGGRFALLGCTVSPGFEYEDYEAGTAAMLANGWPKWAHLAHALSRS